jgi:dipeptidyl aminopeptidase/acylaminoacyl peptidase
VRASGGAPTPIEGIGDHAAALAIASQGKRLVYGRSIIDINMWRMPLPAGGGSAGPPTKLLSSTRIEFPGAYSRDGKRISFFSNRGGLDQIWVADADGSNPVALTNFTAGVAGSPRWSPDGRTIVFDASPEGSEDVYSVSADGGAPKRLTDHRGQNHVPCYSADGRWIYFVSERSRSNQIYRIPANGGEAVQITRHGGRTPLASPDGNWIYYPAWGSGILSKVPAEGGKETAVPGAGGVPNGFALSVAASGVYFVGPLDADSRTWPVKKYRFADGKIAEVARLEKLPRLQIAVSPDEKWLLWAQQDRRTAGIPTRQPLR